eukprot:1562591-Pyramimonas_sp.AAC.1
MGEGGGEERNANIPTRFIDAAAAARQQPWLRRRSVPSATVPRGTEWNAPKSYEWSGAFGPNHGPNLLLLGLGIIVRVSFADELSQ